jgi:hypothetical protein
MGISRILRIAVPVVLIAALAPVGQAAAAPVRYQAEAATVSPGRCPVELSRYTGTGFVNPDDVASSYVEWTVTVAAAGVANLTFRFANGTTAAGRPT